MVYSDKNVLRTGASLLIALFSEIKARINALIPFDAISRSKSIDLQQ